MAALLLLALATLALAQNPYSGATPYVNPDYAAEIDTSIAAHPSLSSLLSKVKTVPTFVWLDTIAKISTLEEHVKRAAAANQLLQIVVYDLPNRDCAAASSNGELLVKDDGVNKYKTLYIQPIAKILNQYPNQKVVMVMEPDSLANLATNLDIAKCSEANEPYRDCVAYAINQLAGPNRYIYLDLAHECWLGWDNNRAKMGAVLKDVIGRVNGGASKIRGFATNVANYCNTHKNSGDPDCGGNNPCADEAAYISKMSSDLSSYGFSNAAYIIDTSRNGRHAIRSDQGSWCNVHNAGMGVRPQLGDGSVTNLDAFVWVKPGGESDGTSNSSATRYDFHCSNSDSTPNAPEAGTWFDSYFVMLAQNANPPL